MDPSSIPSTRVINVTKNLTLVHQVFLTPTCDVTFQAGFYMTNIYEKLLNIQYKR